MIETFPVIQEDILRDPSYPVHAIAGRLLPYLRVLVEKFHPHHVILFGSYAYGDPTPDSDVDLLIVKQLDQSALKDAIAIRQAWRPLHAQLGYLSVHVLVESPERHRYRVAHAAGFYDAINREGLRLV